jgi:hypothetical protein
MFLFYLLNYIDCNLNRLDIGFIKFLFLFYLYLHFCISTVTYKDIEQNVLFKWADHKYVNERKDKQMKCFWQSKCFKTFLQMFDLKFISKLKFYWNPNFGFNCLIFLFHLKMVFSFRCLFKQIERDKNLYWGLLSVFVLGNEHSLAVKQV